MENDCAVYWFWKLILWSWVSVSLANRIVWFDFSGNKNPTGTDGRMQNTEKHSDMGKRAAISIPLSQLTVFE